MAASARKRPQVAASARKRHKRARAAMTVWMFLLTLFFALPSCWFVFIYYHWIAGYRPVQASVPV